MSRRRVLAISQDLDQLRRIVANLERAGADVDAIRSADAITGHVIPHRYIFLALAAGGLSTLDAALSRIREVAQVSLVLPEAGLEDIAGLLGGSRVHHVLTGDEIDRGIFVTSQKLLTGDIFGIEKYLPEGTQVSYTRVNDHRGLAPARDKVLELASRAGLRSHVRRAIGEVCEELVTNALYDAPVDEVGRPLFGDFTAEERLGAASPRPVSIRYAVTESELAVSVRDRFGRLNKKTVVSNLRPGHGLSRVAEKATGCVFNVAHDVATEVICTFDRSGTAPVQLIGMFVHPKGTEQLEKPAG